MDLGKRIKIINKSKKQLFATLTLIILFVFITNAILNLHNNDEFHFKIGKYEYFIILGLLFLSLLSAFLNYKKWPEYSYILYRKGVKVIDGKEEFFIHFKDIEEVLLIPKKSNLGLRVIALAFKTEDSSWMIIGPGHKAEDLYSFKEAYENYIYRFFLEDFKNGKDIKFNYIDDSLIYKKKIMDNKEFQLILEDYQNKKEIILLNNKNIKLKKESFPISHINRIHDSSNDVIEFLNDEDMVLFKLRKYSISNEDIFKILIKQSINSEILL